MSNVFIEKSRQIADSFLQTIVLIDDQAYKGNADDPHDLNALAVTRNFAQKRKLCSVYQPEKETDLNYLAKVANKADIVILDWKLHLENEETTTVDEEEVVAEDDPRGEHTLRIIDSILSDPEPGVSGLKLILIYTGETDLSAIAEVIHNRLKDIYNTNLGTFDVSAINFKIGVIGKPNLQVTHLPEINDRVIDYPALPDFILNEFTQITSGLISNFVLNALCILRSNTSRLLQTFSKKIDPAFLAHCALLPDYEDAQEQLVEMFSQSVNALLNYNKAGAQLSIERIEEWIDAQSLPNSNITIGQNSYNIDSAFLKKWVRENFVEAIKAKVEESGASFNDPFKEKVESKERSLHNTATQYFTTDTHFDQKDLEFSILTHQKSNFKHPSFEPRLTLGTIIRKEVGTEVKYYVCIQQKCDSVRINEPRQFLFLPLIVVTGSKKFHFVVEEDSEFYRLRVDFSTFNIKIVLFDPTNGIIKAVLEEGTGKYYFHSNSDGDFLWLSDLKDSHAQRLSNQFASQLSRIGLDESEWLRRWASN